MNRPGVFLLLPRWDTTGYPQYLICWNPFIRLGGEKGLFQEHNTMSPARVEPQTAQSRDEHEATAPPSESLFQGGILFYSRL